MATILTSIDVALEPRAAFDSICAELSSALERLGLRFSAGPDDSVTAGALEIGRVVSWTPGERLVFEWHPATWDPSTATTLELRVEPRENGALITVEIGGWDRVVHDPGELVGWFGSEVAAPLLQHTSPSALGDWLTDRLARRPSGSSSRAIYRDPLYHYPNFHVILHELALAADDYLLEVGCGGGALLKAALRSGCRAAAVDHSHEMVRLARAENAEAVAAERLDVREARADSLPFPDCTFTCAAMTGVLGFLADPVAALAEIRRVLTPGGRLTLSVPNATGFAPFHRLGPLVPGAWLRGKLLPYEHPANTDQPIDTCWTFREIESLVAAGGFAIDRRDGLAYFRYLEMLPIVRSVWRPLAPAAERMLPRMGGARFAYHVLLRCRPAGRSVAA